MDHKRMVVPFFVDKVQGAQGDIIEINYEI